jgi:hypothetical protein
VNARHLLILTIPLLISGCGTFGLFPSAPDVKQVQIQTKAVERTPLNLKEPEPLKARELKFIIITKENFETVMKDLVDKNMDPVVFALTDDGYEQLSLTIAEIRNLLATQKSIIARYKEYYEPPKKSGVQEP